MATGFWKENRCQHQLATDAFEQWSWMAGNSWSWGTTYASDGWHSKSDATAIFLWSRLFTVRCTPEAIATFTYRTTCVGNYRISVDDLQVDNSGINSSKLELVNASSTLQLVLGWRGAHGMTISTSASLFGKSMFIIALLSLLLLL